MSDKRKDNRFTLSFGKKDDEAAEWLFAQEDKGAYLKALILEDMQKAVPAKEGTEIREEVKIYPAVQPAG